MAGKWIVVKRTYSDDKKMVVAARDTEEMAQKTFLNILSETISNFDEYRSCDIDAILDSGREGFGSGELYISYDRNYVGEEDA